MSTHNLESIHESSEETLLPGELGKNESRARRYNYAEQQPASLPK